MSPLLSSGAILTASRLSNFGILLISPLLLVRILEVEAYGQYREFTLYAVLLTALCSLNIESSLTYFLPKYPRREKLFLTQTSIFVFLLSSFFLGSLYLLRDLFLQVTTFDFVLPLIAYVAFFSNMNWIEYYWVANRKVPFVLYYSTARLLVRISVLLSVAYITRSVTAILWALAIVEATRILAVLAYVAKNRMLAWNWNYVTVLEQLRFVTPVGLASVVQHGSRDIGRLFIAGVLGPSALAYYAVGSYLLPLINVVRSSIADVLFPELVRSSHEPLVALNLWRRANILSCALMFPGYVLLLKYSDLVIEVLFTNAYTAAIPVFEIYLLFLIRRCFNFDALVRMRGATLFVLYGSIGSLVLNVLLMLFFYRLLGFVGPALAFIVSDAALEFYYAHRAKRALAHYMGNASIYDWKGLAIVLVSCVAVSPILFLLDGIHLAAIPSALLSSCLFLLAVWLLAFSLGLKDIGRVVDALLGLIRTKPRST